MFKRDQIIKKNTRIIINRGKYRFSQNKFQINTKKGYLTKIKFE